MQTKVLQYLLYLEFTDLTLMFQDFRKVLHPSVASRTITGFVGITVFIKRGSRLCYLTFSQPVVTPYPELPVGRWGSETAASELVRLSTSCGFLSIRFLTRKVRQLLRLPDKLPQLSCFLKHETRCTFSSSLSVRPQMIAT